MKIGINAMSTIGAMAQDFEGTIKRLREAGLDYIEAMSDWGARPETIEFYTGLTGSSGWDPENTLRRLEVLRSYGMDIRGIFIFDEALDEQAEELGKYCGRAGIRYVVLSFLKYDGIDDIYNKIELIRRTAKILKPFGVQICQHNHEHDVVFITDRDGVRKPVIDIFLEQLSPEELMLEMDTGWVQYAGLDPVQFIRERLDRVGILHFKDICRDFKSVSREEIFVPCGQGAVDFPAVLGAIPEDRREMIGYVIDQDASKGDIVEDLAEAIAYFKNMENESE